MLTKPLCSSYSFDNPRDYTKINKPASVQRCIVRNNQTHPVPELYQLHVTDRTAWYTLANQTFICSSSMVC